MNFCISLTYQILTDCHLYATSATSKNEMAISNPFENNDKCHIYTSATWYLSSI